MAVTEEQRKERFWEAQAEKEKAIYDAVRPLTEKREKIAADIAKLEVKLREIDKQIKQAERPVVDLSREIVQLARSLGGRVGENPVLAKKDKKKKG